MLSLNAKTAPLKVAAAPKYFSTGISALKASGRPRAPPRSQSALKVSNRYPDPAWIEKTKKEFEEGEKGVATAEEAMCLIKNGGYTYLDVRSELANDMIGKVPGSINIPIIKAKRRFDTELKDNVIETEDLPDFVERVKAKFPDLTTPLLVGCATGKKYSLNALMALDEGGYENLAGLKGGYNAWIRLWDNNFRRRGNPTYETVYNADGDGMGIHSTGAGFEMVDELVLYTSDDF